MMKISNEIKAKIYSQYLPYFIGNPSGLLICVLIGKYITAMEDKKIPDYRIELKRLAAISDEDAIEVAKLLGEEGDLLYWGKYMCDKFTSNDKISVKKVTVIHQYLQSRGYAMPYLNYSVEDLIEANVYKIVG